MKSFSEKVALVLSSIIVIAAIGFIALAVIFYESKTYQVF